MLQSTASAGGPLDYRGPRTTSSGERTTALCAVACLHAVLIGAIVVARTRAPAAPPESVLSVSLITESAAPAPAPASAPQPVPQPSERRMIATPRPTPSPMSAPPVEVAPQPRIPAPASASLATTVPSSAAPGPPSPLPIAPPNFTAAYLNNPGPAYPASARRKRQEGTVRLRVRVSAEGVPTQVLVERTSGSPDLDTAALEVVSKRWKFAPAKEGDRAVAAWVIVPIEFTLKR